MNKTTLLFLIILVEGYVVLACELLAIRQLIPFVGSGTETVSILISAVLLPLAVGYHAGGQSYKKHYRRAKKRGKRPPSVRKLLLKNLISALLVLVIGLSYGFLELFFALLDGLGIQHRLVQTSCYSLLFLVLPVFLLGQTVPLVSNYFPRRKLSEITGKMLFFSTTGSFLGSVFSTIVLMTVIGVHNTVTVTLALLCVLTLLLLKRLLSYETLCCAVVLLLAATINSDSAMRKIGIVSDNAYNIVAIIKVPAEDAIIMNINRSYSSKISKDGKHDFAYIDYIRDHIIAPLVRQKKEPRDILVIGAGGFTVGLHDQISRYTYVDIDKALKPAAEKYFLKKPLPPNAQFIAESARAFVHRDAGQYDLIVIDTYSNKIAVPMECTTREFLLDVKKRLKPGGSVVINMIASADFSDRFAVRYDNTFASVFPAYTRQVIGGNVFSHTVNALYIYRDNPLVNDAGIYTDDKNTYSLDRD